MASGSAQGLSPVYQAQRWLVEVPLSREMGKEAALLAVREAEDMGAMVELVMVAVLTDTGSRAQKGEKLEKEKVQVERNVLKPFCILASTNEVKAFPHVEVSVSHQQGLSDSAIKLRAAKIYLNTKKNFSLLNRTAATLSFLEAHLPPGITVVVVKGGKKDREVLTSGSGAAKDMRSLPRAGSYDPGPLQAADPGYTGSMEETCMRSLSLGSPCQKGIQYNAQQPVLTAAGPASRAVADVTGAGCASMVTTTQSNDSWQSTSTSPFLQGRVATYDSPVSGVFPGHNGHTPGNYNVSSPRSIASCADVALSRSAAGGQWTPLSGHEMESCLALGSEKETPPMLVSERSLGKPPRGGTDWTERSRLGDRQKPSPVGSVSDAVHAYGDPSALGHPLDSLRYTGGAPGGVEQQQRLNEVDELGRAVDTEALMKEVARARESAAQAQLAAEVARIEARRAKEEARMAREQMNRAGSRARSAFGTSVAGSFDEFEDEQLASMAYDSSLGASRRTLTLKEELEGELCDTIDEDDLSQVVATPINPRATGSTFEYVEQKWNSGPFHPNQLGSQQLQGIKEAASATVGNMESAGEGDGAHKLTSEEGASRHRRGMSSSSSESFGARQGGSDCRRFTVDQLRDATENFATRNLLGRGSYGPVYRGQLMGCEVAVKRLEAGKGQGMREFRTEVDVLSRVRHPNIVLLMGQCPEDFSLVYEFLPGGSLQQRLNPDEAHGQAPKPPLAWHDRIRILSEVASALLFMHRYEPPILHRDLKPDNILLDASEQSKVSDVGLARLVHDGRTYECSMKGMGTVGFIDPEMMRTGEIGVKADLYAFGVVMLIMLFGAKSAKHAHGLLLQELGPPQQDLSGMSRNIRQSVRALVKHLDRQAGNWDEDMAKEALALALRCIERESRHRPDLESVVLPCLKEMTKEAKELQDQKHGSASAMFFCPISKQIMRDPVVAADGFTYEREHVLDWLRNSDNSPVTGQPLAHRSLAPNNILKELIASSSVT